MNDLICYLDYNNTSGFTYGLRGVDLEDVIFSFYLLKNGKKYRVTGYQEKKQIEYQEVVDEGVYQAIGFFKIKLESGQYSDPFIVKSDSITIESVQRLSDQSKSVFNKRSIRLKEWGVNILKDFEPSEEYLRYRCSSLSRKKYRLKTNEFGFIVNSKEVPQQENDQIVFLGASQVECLYVEEGKRLADEFQKKINMACFEVLNGGYSGTTSLQILNTLLNKVTQIEPKKIYFFLPTNDIYAFRNGGYWNGTARFSPIIPEKSMRSVSALAKDKWKSELFKVYSVIKSVCDTYNIEAFFSTFPHINNINNKYISNVYKDNVANELIKDRLYLNKIFKEVIKSIGGTLIDLEELVKFNEEYFYDDVHFNEQGCKGVATILAANSKL